MSKRPSFIPGRLAMPEPPLAHYRPQLPVGAANDYVCRLTAPDALVVDLFCQGPPFVREALAAGRRVLGFSVNPLLLLAARFRLRLPDPQALNAAFTRLADSRRGDTPLRSYLASLYRTQCPTCHASGTAEWFAWRRDVGQPFEKAVRCSNCGGMQVGATDQADVALAQSFAPRGLPYYYALDRAAPLNHPVRERTAELVGCYTARNLSALMDLSRRMEGLDAAEDVKIALMALLLDCFDRCSKLHPHGEDRPRPRTLRIPVRYLERNVWLCLEEGLAHLLHRQRPAVAPEMERVDDLVRGRAKGYALVACAARDVVELLPANSVDLILVDPPRPDGVFWALSALWASWLWDTSDAHAMRPFLRRRRFDWHWHWRVLRESLEGMGSRLTDAGLLVFLFAAPDRAMLQSVCLAAAGAGYRLRTWGYAREAGYRLVWRWEGRENCKAIPVEVLTRRAAGEVEEAVISTLRQRGEPTSESMLHAAAHTRLADKGLLERIAALDNDISPPDFLVEVVDQGLGAAPMIELVKGAKQQARLWWLLKPADRVGLADRVEVLVRQLLSERLVWREDDLVNAVYAHFPGLLTPDLTLVHVCVASYGVIERKEVRLRSEDDLERRRREIDTVCQDLSALGQRLGFQTSRGGAWDVCWSDDEGEAYVFAISATAMVTSRLLDVCELGLETRCCLVVPGGRAKLVDLKLQRDPRLAQAVDSGRWQFIKFRHLRRLVAEEDLDRYAFEIVLGLDPIAEREHTQLLLF